MEVTPEIAQQNATNFFLDATSVLYRMNQPDQPYHTAKLLVIPSSLKEEILIACHDHPLSGHLGFDKTLHKIQDRYWWPKIYSKVKEYVATRKPCLLRKQHYGFVKAPMQSFKDSSVNKKPKLSLKEKRKLKREKTKKN